MASENLTFNLPSAQLDSTHQVTCTQWGNPAAPRAVVCVHGLTRNRRDFDFLADALSDAYRVLCPDLPGRGESQWLKDPAGYNYPAYVSDLKSILDTLELSRVDWVGTSMGGIIGMMLANAYPGLIRSLVLNDIGCLVSAAGLRRIRSYAGLRMIFNTRAAAEAELRRVLEPFGIRDERQWQHLLAHNIQQVGDGSVRLSYDPAIAASLPDEADLKDIDLWPFWEAITGLPVLLLRGAESDILARETAQEMKARHPQLTLYEVEGAGHAPTLMDDGQIALIRSWLDR